MGSPKTYRVNQDIYINILDCNKEMIPLKMNNSLQTYQFSSVLDAWSINWFNIVNFELIVEIYLKFFVFSIFLHDT